MKTAAGVVITVIAFGVIVVAFIVWMVGDYPGRD